MCSQTHTHYVHNPHAHGRVCARVHALMCVGTRHIVHPPLCTHACKHSCPHMCVRVRCTPRLWSLHSAPRTTALGPCTTVGMLCDTRTRTHACTLECTHNAPKRTWDPGPRGTRPRVSCSVVGAVWFESCCPWAQGRPGGPGAKVKRDR